MSNLSTMYIDRIEASEVLKVSTRTLDRYLRKYRIKSRRDGRRILIRRDDIEKIIHDNLGHFLDINIDKSRETIDSQSVQDVSSVEVRNVQIEEVRDRQKIEEDQSIYKDLYVETKIELKDRQDRLEAATYRVGQLEAQLKNMVPLLDYTRKEKELKETQEGLEKKAFEAALNIERMERKVRSERIAKWVYLSLVGMLLIAEPVLFLYWAFN